MHATPPHLMSSHLFPPLHSRLHFSLHFSPTSTPISILLHSHHSFLTPSILRVMLFLILPLPWCGQNGTDKMVPIESSINQAIQLPHNMIFFINPAST